MGRHACLWVRSVLLACALTVTIACGGSPLFPGKPPVVEGCGLDAVGFNPADPTCTINAPQCPRLRPATAQTIIAVSTCGFGEGETSCPPVLLNCPYKQPVVLQFLVVNSLDNALVCPSFVDAAIDPTPEGGEVHWSVQERQAAFGGGCQFVGEPYEGQATVQGICCEKIVDIPLRHWRRTFRLVARSDWQ